MAGIPYGSSAPTLFASGIPAFKDNSFQNPSNDLISQPNLAVSIPSSVPTVFANIIPALGNFKNEDTPQWAPNSVLQQYETFYNRVFLPAGANTEVLALDTSDINLFQVGSAWSYTMTYSVVQGSSFAGSSATGGIIATGTFTVLSANQITTSRAFCQNSLAVGVANPGAFQIDATTSPSGLTFSTSSADTFAGGYVITVCSKITPLF